MPADFSEYIDLSIFDKEPGDIYLDSIELARLVIPDFNLRVGTPEDAMFQAAAYISALNINAINRLPSRLMSGLISMLGYQRQEAIPAEVDVEITLGDYDGGTIPSGTVFIYDSIFEDEIQQYAFQTTSSTTLPATDLEVSTAYPSGKITVTCLQPGVIPPLSAGDELIVQSSGTDIISVIVATPSNFANGVNDDQDDDYLSKSATYLRSLSSALVKPAQVDSYLLTKYPGLMERVKTYDTTNGDFDSGNISVKRSSGIIKTHLASNIATIETEAPHLFVVGDVVELDIYSASVSATFNGTHEIQSVPTDTTFTFSKTASTSASTVVTGSAYAGSDVSGFITIFAYGSGVELTISEKNEVASDVRAKSTAGLIVDVTSPTLVYLDISACVTLDDKYDQTQLQQTVEDVLLDYLSPAKYAFTDRIRLSQLISLISSIPGVVYVDSMSISPNTSAGWLPQHGDDLLFLNKGTLPLLALENIDFGYSSISTET